MENVHYLYNPKDVEEALANPKAHWNDLEDRRRDCVGWTPSYKSRAHWTSGWKNICGSAKRKRCVVNMARLCAVVNLLYISAPALGL